VTRGECPLALCPGQQRSHRRSRPHHASQAFSFVADLPPPLLGLGLGSLERRLTLLGALLRRVTLDLLDAAVGLLLRFFDPWLGLALGFLHHASEPVLGRADRG